MVERYDIEMLSEINTRYIEIGKHTITQSDVDMANKYVRLIESSRSIVEPKAGDIIQFTNKYGDYYHRGHIEQTDNEKVYLCEQPYTPFVFVNNQQLSYNTSGGAWQWAPKTELKYIYKMPKRFCDWGNCGACADGAVEFEAWVSVWEYKEPGSLYGDYSTKDYDKFVIDYCVDAFGYPRNGSPYRYFGDGFAFKNKAEYDAWLKTYRGVEFKNEWRPNQTTVFAYRKKEILISENDWNDLNYPIDTRLCNGSVIPVKVNYDDDNHIVTEYRYTNRIENGRFDYLGVYYLARKENFK